MICPKIFDRNKVVRALFHTVMIAVALWLSSDAIYARKYVLDAAADTLTMRSVFERLDSPALQLLSHDTRLDMLESADAGIEYQATNSMGGPARLVQLTPEYLEVTITDASEAQMRLLPYKGGRIVALSYTVDGGDAPDSQLLFYDSQLRPLDADKFFTPPVLTDFLNTSGLKKNQVSALIQDVPFITVALSLSPGDTCLKAQLSVKGIISTETCNKLAPYISSQDSGEGVLTYIWNGSRYRIADPAPDK